MTKGQKLLNRPVDNETMVLLEDLVDFGDFPGLMELWKWSGVTASSIIVLKEDVKHLGQMELIEFLFQKMKLPVDPQTTYSENGDYIYVNFGFKGDD